MHKNYSLRSSGLERKERLRPWFRDFHRLVMDGDYDYPVHRHKEYELIWIERGPYNCMLNGQLLELAENCILIVKPDDLHMDILRNKQIHYVLHFSLNLPLFRENASTDSQVLSGTFPKGQELFGRLEEESKRGDRFSSSLQDALLETFFWQIIRSIPEEALSESLVSYNAKERFAGKLFNCFNKAVPGDLTVENMAKEIGISKRSLSYYCREYLEDSPARLFLRFRLDRCRALLKDTDLSIKDISLREGFDTPFNFSRAFQRMFGKSPSEYRNHDK